MAGDLKAEFQRYLTNKAEYLEKYRGSFIALKGGKLLGVYKDRVEAIKTTASDHKIGSFLVQHVTDEDDQVRFRSRHS